MQSRKSTRNLIIFWIFALIFLAGFYFFLESGKDQNENIQNSESVDWTGDYLMISEYNLGALKTDRRINRAVDYSVDFSKEKPEAVLKISFENIGQNNDWPGSDFHDYLRVYAPKGSWLWKSENVGKVSYEEENNKKVFAFNIKATPAETVVTELHYTLPENIENNSYQLLLQKQSDSNAVPVKIHLTDAGGNTRTFSLELKKDYRFALDEFPENLAEGKNAEPEQPQPAQNLYQKAGSFAGIVEAANASQKNASVAETAKPAKIINNPKLIPSNSDAIILAEAPKVKAKAPAKKIDAPMPYVFKKDQSGRLVCNKSDDHPQKSEQNKKKHLDMECCLDPDETPNPRCYYSPEKYGKYLK